MTPKKFLGNVRVPMPASELRDKVLSQAKKSFGAELSASWTDRLWKNRGVRYAWSTGVIVSLLVLIFWNPTLPGMKGVEFTEQISKDDRMEINALGIQQKPAMTVQFRNVDTFQILEGEDL